MHNDYGDKLLVRVEVEQNPLDRAIIYKRIYDKENKFIKKIPYEVGIAKSKNSFLLHIILLKTTQKEKSDTSIFVISQNFLKINIQHFFLTKI